MYLIVQYKYMKKKFYFTEIEYKVFFVRYFHNFLIICVFFS